MLTPHLKERKYFNPLGFEPCFVLNRALRNAESGEKRSNRTAEPGAKRPGSRRMHKQANLTSTAVEYIQRGPGRSAPGSAERSLRSFRFLFQYDSFISRPACNSL